MLDSFGVWSLGVGSNIAMVLQSQKDESCSHGSLKVIDVTAFVLLFSACFSDIYGQLGSIIMAKGSSVSKLRMYGQIAVGRR